MKEIILYVVFSITLFILLSNFLDTYNQKENFKQIVEGLTNNSDVAFGGNMEVNGNVLFGGQGPNGFTWVKETSNYACLRAPGSQPNSGAGNRLCFSKDHGIVNFNPDGSLGLAGSLNVPGGLTVDGNISASKFYHGNSSVDANLRITFQQSNANYYNAPAGGSGEWVHIFRRNGTDIGYIHSNGYYYQTSDLRLKTNFEPLTNVIDSIKQIRGLKFNFKNSVSDKKSHGLIAQDVEKVFPELVTTNEDGEKLKSISYSNMVPILVEAIKEQQKMIEELQEKIKMSR